MKMSDSVNLSDLQNKNVFFSNFALTSFYLGVALLFFLKFLGLNFGDDVYKIGTIISLFFLFIKGINTKYTKKEMIHIGLLILLAAALLFISGRPALPMSILILVSSKGINKNDFIKIAFFSSLIAFITVIILGTIGIFDNIMITMDRLTAEGVIHVTRYSLGYYHPNVTYMNFFIIVTLYFLYKNNNIKNYMYIAILALSIILYQITLSRTGFICLLIILFLSITLKYNIINRFKCISFLRYLPFILGCGIILLSLLYDGNNQVFIILDKLFSGRLYYNNLFLTQMPISILGVDMSILENADLFLDCGYVLLFLSHGIFVFALFMYYTYKILKGINYRTDILFYIIVSVLIYCITEYFLTNILINYTLIYYNKFIFEEKS